MESEILKRIYERLGRIEEMLSEQRSASVVKAMMNAEEVSRYTGYTYRYIHKLTGDHLIPHYKRGGKLFFKKEEIDAWLQERRVSTDDEITTEAKLYCSGRRLRK